MPLIGYKKQFAGLIESGVKRQTVRAKRKRPFKPGDRLYHYTGLRTKRCRKLRESICISADYIHIDLHGYVSINDRDLTMRECEELALLDGFVGPGSAWIKMHAFFRSVHSLPFDGQVIKW